MSLKLQLINPFLLFWFNVQVTRNAKVLSKVLKDVYFLNLSDFIWCWDPDTLSSSVCLTRGNKEVLFHPDYSCGTAAARGSLPLTQGGEYYWEIKMTSAVYGTDMVRSWFPLF